MPFSRDIFRAELKIKSDLSQIEEGINVLSIIAGRNQEGVK